MRPSNYSRWRPRFRRMSPRRPRPRSRPPRVRRQGGVVRALVGRVRQCRDRHAPSGRAARLVRAAPRLGRAQPGLSRRCEEMFERAARAAIEQAGLAPDRDRRRRHRLDTGIATPSLEARVGPRIGLRGDVRRVPVFGLGCAGGVSGLALASRLAARSPARNWLFVTVETCSISIRLDSDDPAAIVATALFGDGAAAAVVRAGEGGSRRSGRPRKCGRTRSESWAGGSRTPALAVVFDRAIPPFIEAELGRRRRRNVRAARYRPRGHRPLLLPSRRGQGDRRHRNRAPASHRASSTSSAKCSTIMAT